MTETKELLDKYFQSKTDLFEHIGIMSEPIYDFREETWAYKDGILYWGDAGLDKGEVYSNYVDDDCHPLLLEPGSRAWNGFVWIKTPECGSRGGSIRVFDRRKDLFFIPSFASDFNVDRLDENVPEIEIRTPPGNLALEEMRAWFEELREESKRTGRAYWIAHEKLREDNVSETIRAVPLEKCLEWAGEDSE